MKSMNDEFWDCASRFEAAEHRISGDIDGNTGDFGMTEREKAISQLCIMMQGYCDKLREEYDLVDNSYYMNCIEHCIERIHRSINPKFDEICKDIERLEANDK